MWRIAGLVLVLFAALLVWVCASPRRDVSLKLIRFETNLSTVAPVPFDKPQPYVTAVLRLTNASESAVNYLGNPSGHPFCRLSAKDHDAWLDENESLAGFGMGGAGYRTIKPSPSVDFGVLIESAALTRARGSMTVSVPYYIPLSTNGVWNYLPTWAERRLRHSRHVA